MLISVSYDEPVRRVRICTRNHRLTFHCLGKPGEGWFGVSGLHADGPLRMLSLHKPFHAPIREHLLDILGRRSSDVRGLLESLAALDQPDTDRERVALVQIADQMLCEMDQKSAKYPLA
jgi:hypothetical protein